MRRYDRILKDAMKIRRGRLARGSRSDREVVFVDPLAILREQAPVVREAEEAGLIDPAPYDAIQSALTAALLAASASVEDALDLAGPTYDVASSGLATVGPEYELQLRRQSAALGEMAYLERFALAAAEVVRLRALSSRTVRMKDR